MQKEPCLSKYLILSSLSFLLFFGSCDNKEVKTMEVTASAYNAVPEQTNKEHPTTAAWGDELKPGMKCIAVSRDLIREGLNHGTKVKIEGLPGTYVVLDKMNQRWTKKIDIYMGNDKAAAKEWGERKVKITWELD